MSMPNNSSWLISATLYDEDTNNFKQYYTVVNAPSYAKAAEKVADYYGDPSTGCAQLIITFADDCPVELSREEYERLLKDSF